MPYIVLRNISKKYEDGFQAVDNINLEIKEKEFLIFVGPSGCGKSTTLRMIAGLEEVSSGELWIGDVLANYQEPGERNLAMVFQNYALYPHMNVYRNIAFSLEIRGVDKLEIDGKVKEVAKLLGLTEVLDRYPKALSGGQRQRVAIGNAIIRNPEILLMDEPLSNLDAKLRCQMRVELAKIHKQLGNTIIYVTHDQTEAMTLGTRIAVMDKGRIQQVDTPEKLYNNPINLFVAGFIGSPAMNILPCELIDGDENPKINIGESSIACTGIMRELIRKLNPDRKLQIGIRPEAFWDVHRRKKENRNDLDKEQEIFVTVTHRELMGNEVILYFTLAGQNCCMKAGAENDARVADTIPVWIDTENIHIFDPLSGKNLLYEKRRHFERWGD